MICESLRADTKLLTEAGSLQLWSSVDIQTRGSAARTFWPFLAERMGTSSAPQMSATGSLVDLILILSCSRRSLYNFLWKPCELMWIWVLCTTPSWSPGLVQFGVPPVGKIQMKLSMWNLKKGNMKSLDSTMKQSHFAVTVNLLQAVE